KYAYLLIELIESHNLNQYDREIFVANVHPKRPAEIEKEMTIKVGHTVKIQANGVQFVIVGDGDTFYKVAKEFDLTLNQLYRYNDIKNETVLHSGDVLYVEAKKSRAKTETHLVQNGDSMWKISQQ